MLYQFFIEGITCESCVKKITATFRDELNLEDISFSEANTRISFQSSREINIQALNDVLVKIGPYKVKNEMMDNHEAPSYYPIYILFAYLVGANILIAFQGITMEKFMVNFMASFFLVFSFFKFLDLKGFSEGYASYDIVAKKFRYYGYVYPFIELGFGIAYLLFGSVFYLNALVFIIMLISSVGVLKATFSKKKFTCACVGTFLKVPLGSIALIEDLMMVGMSLLMMTQL